MTFPMTRKGFEPLPVFVRQLPDRAPKTGSVFSRWREGRERMRQHRQLLNLDDRVLRDIGVTRFEVQQHLNQMRAAWFDAAGAGLRRNTTRY